MNEIVLAKKFPALSSKEKNCGRKFRHPCHVSSNVSFALVLAWSPVTVSCHAEELVTTTARIKMLIAYFDLFKLTN